MGPRPVSARHAVIGVVALLYAATALAFWKGLHEPDARRWRVAVGVLVGLGFVEKMAAVTVVLPLVAWLVSESCDVSGQVLVSGGGRLRAAMAVEGPPVDMRPGEIGAAVHLAMTAQPREAYGDAHLAFEAFMDGRPGLVAAT